MRRYQRGCRYENRQPLPMERIGLWNEFQKIEGLCVTIKIIHKEKLQGLKKRGNQNEQKNILDSFIEYGIR